jgi:hypothetical protein
MKLTPTVTSYPQSILPPTHCSQLRDRKCSPFSSKKDAMGVEEPNCQAITQSTRFSSYCRICARESPKRRSKRPESIRGDANDYLMRRPCVFPTRWVPGILLDVYSKSLSLRRARVVFPGVHISAFGKLFSSNVALFLAQDFCNLALCFVEHAEFHFQPQGNQYSFTLFNLNAGGSFLTNEPYYFHSYNEKSQIHLILPTQLLLIAIFFYPYHFTSLSMLHNALAPNFSKQCLNTVTATILIIICYF